MYTVEKGTQYSDSSRAWSVAGIERDMRGGGGSVQRRATRGRGGERGGGVGGVGGVLSLCMAVVV